MSVYNYPLATTPNFDKLKKTSNLFIFDDVIAPHAYTTAAISKIFTFLNYENQSSLWYKQKNIIDIMNTVGYTTYWISNQMWNSNFENAPDILAKRAKKTLYLGNLQKKDYIIIEELKKIQKTTNEFYVIHLMGTHVDYSQRYPDDFNFFSKENLISNNLHMLNSKKLNSRKLTIKSNYLNSILYNDYVVSNIFEHFKDENALIFYLSDHGDEVYDFRNFYGHSETNISKYMVEIPFMIYTSDTFISSYPEIISKIRIARQNPFMSDDFIHSFLDLINITTDELDFTRSLFNTNYNKKRMRIVNNQDYDTKLKFL
ncbi:phosphoethanolamine transferase [Campylobacter lari]|nr:phosphoethanolamine transferase [Campylobacter lari]